MNRRNVLTGLGGLAISGGALFGSGAFTSVEATRSVEVNVFGADSGTDGLVDDANQGQEENIASTIKDNAVDVLVDTSSSSVSISEGAAADLFPSNPDSKVYSGIGNEYVSLVANDVTVVFGSTDDADGLPPNSELGYSALFEFIPNSTSGSTFDVTFGDGNGGSVLTKVGGDTVDDGATVQVSSGGSADATISTTGSDDTEDLDISIEQQ